MDLGNLKKKKDFKRPLLNNTVRLILILGHTGVKGKSAAEFVSNVLRCVVTNRIKKWL